MTITVKSVYKCKSLLKWPATGESSVLLRRLIEWRQFILQWRGSPVSPTYCWSHIQHVITYTRVTLEDSQEALIISLNRSPVVLLEKAFVANSMGQVLHLTTLHGWLPGSPYDIDLKDARTRRSFRFLGRWKVMSAGVGSALHNRSETWKMDRCCFILKPKDSKREWYLTTKGVRADFSCFCLDHKDAFLDVSSRSLIFLSNSCSLYPLLKDIAWGLKYS